MLCRKSACLSEREKICSVVGKDQYNFIIRGFQAKSFPFRRPTGKRLMKPSGARNSYFSELGNGSLNFPS